MKKSERKTCRASGGGKNGIRRACNRVRYCIMATVAFLFVAANLSISAFASGVVNVHRTGIQDAPTTRLWLDPTYDFLIKNATFAQSGSSYRKDASTNKIYTDSAVDETNSDSFTLTWNNVSNVTNGKVVLTVSNVLRRGGDRYPPLSEVVLSDDTSLNSLIFGAGGNNGSCITADFKLSFIKNTGELDTETYLLSVKDLGPDSSVEFPNDYSGDIYLTADSTLSVKQNPLYMISTSKSTNPYASGFVATMKSGGSFQIAATGASPVTLFDNVGCFYVKSSGDSHVTVSPSVLKAQRKSSATVSAMTFPGYKINTATMDGKSVLNGLLTTDEGDGRFLYQYRIGTILANHNIYFASAPVSYVIDFDSGGGTGYMNPIPAVYDTAKELPANTFTKQGCTFKGWALEGTSSPIYRDGESVKNLTPIEGKRVKLVAQWEVPTCTVTFMNGHTNSVISVVSVNKGSTAMAPSYPTYTGYTALGWDKSLDSITTDTVITARYRPNTYKIIFNKNAAGATGTMSPLSMEYDAKKTLTANAFSYAGHTFALWTTQPDGSGMRYSDMQSVGNLTDVDGGTVNLYAKWTPLTYTVTFRDGYDGSTIKTARVSHGDSVTEPSFPSHIGYTATGWDSPLSNITSNRTITANYRANTYRIVFDRNADDATGDMPSMDMTYASTKNLTANSYSRTGYTWNGWNTQADGRGTPYLNRQSVSNLVTADNGSVTLYAQWVPNTYTIKFVDGHDGTAIKSVQLEYGSAITAPNAPEHAGYTATGWDKTPGSVTGDETFTMSYRANTYTVRFDKNNQAATGSMSDQQMAYGTAKKLNRNAFSYTGRTWIGWTTKSDGSGKSYKDEESVSNLTEVDGGTVTLYAQWSTNAYTVRFIDGHDNSVIKTQQVDYGKSATAPDKPVHKGYTASSWDGNYTNVTHNESVTLSYRANSYSIAFDSNGGSGTMPNQQLKYDKSVRLDANTFTRTGYTFTGWKGKTGDASYTDRQEVTNLSATDGDTVTLVAQWKANSYTVKFDSNGGSGTMAPQKMTYGTPTRLTKNAFSNTGHTFSGWRCGDRQNGQIYRDSEEVSNLVAENGGSTTMYAQWDTNDVSVTFVDGHTGKVIEKKTVKYGSGVSAPSKPKHEGYTATDWNGDLTSIIADTTITLNYRPNRYTVKFNGNADGVNGETQSMDMEYGVTKGLTANGYSREGYDWTGWSTSPDGTGTKYNNGQDISNLTASDGGTVTLYACWKIKRCTVTFIDGFDNTVILRKEVDYGTTVPVPEPPVHKGYKPVKSNPTVQSDMSVTIKYEPISYTIRFDGNAANVSGTTASMNMKYGAKANLTENGYSREGYDWTGWSRSSDGTGTKYSNGQEVSNLSDSDNSTVTLYACWKIKRCTITFIDGFDNKVISKQEVDYGTKIPTPKAPEHKGYKVVETDQTATSDMNVTVKYEPISYTVRFNGNAGSVTGSMSSITMKYDESRNLPANAFKYRGYNFAGWESGKAIYPDCAEIRNLAETDGAVITLNAKWVEDSHIVITYSVKTDDGKGNCKVSNALDDLNQTSGTPKGSTATPSEEYDFKGWYDVHGELISEKETYVPQKPGNGKWTAAAYTALFTRKEFKVIFRGQDGTVLSEQVVKYGETPKTPEPPVLDGYKFVRWDGDISSITGNIDTKPIYEKITQEDSGNKNSNENADNANNNNNGNENMNNNTDKNSKDSTDQLQDGLQSILQTGVDIIVSPLAIVAASISAALAAIFRRRR